jgi:hypothetical protein
MVNIGLLKLPQLRKRVLTQGVDKAVRVNHRKCPVQSALWLITSQ